MGGGVEVVEEAGVDADAAGFAVPRTVGLEVGCVAVSSATAGGAEVMRDHV